MKCALHFATKLNSRDIQKCNCFWPSLPCNQSSHISDEQLSGHALMHLQHDLDIDEICTITRGGCSKGASFTSRTQIHRRGQGITCNCDWCEGVWGRSNLPQKSSTVFPEPKFGPPPPPTPNEKFLDSHLFKLASNVTWVFPDEQIGIFKLWAF